MAELVVEDTTRGKSLYYHIVTQEHLGDVPHAAIINASGFRVALFRGETWDGCREAAMGWVERRHELDR